jgi:hypothetical protein
LTWWYTKEDEIIDYIEALLSSNPYAGADVDSGSFKGLSRITYGKSKHTYHVKLYYLLCSS